MAVYLTQTNDTIDGISFAFYGASRGYTEIVLDANPDLAFESEFLTPGLRITLPESPRLEVRTGFALWE